MGLTWLPTSFVKREYSNMTHLATTILTVHYRRRQLREDAKHEYELLTKMIPNYENYLEYFEADYSTLLGLCSVVSSLLSLSSMDR